MAQRTQTAFEFIQSAFCPMVAVMCSEDADKVCQKNNLSFVEMVRPFCHLTSEGNYYKIKIALLVFRSSFVLLLMSFCLINKYQVLKDCKTSSMHSLNR